MCMHESSVGCVHLFVVASVHSCTAGLLMEINQELRNPRPRITIKLTKLFYILLCSNCMQIKTRAPTSDCDQTRLKNDSKKENPTTELRVCSYPAYSNYSTQRSGNIQEHSYSTVGFGS